AKEIAANIVLYSVAAPATYSPRPAVISWLDQQRPNNWNGPGPAIPGPAEPVGIAPECSTLTKSADTPEETSLARAGWFLFAGAQQQCLGSVVVVFAMSGSGGMCRPFGYQAFVFVQGLFAGTLAPAPMYPRSDGAAG